MIKRFSLLIMVMLLFATSAFAENEQPKEKVVTARWSFVSGDATVTNHYLSKQEYNGPTFGLSMEFGSFYKKSDNVSWDVDITGITSPYIELAQMHTLANPAKTSFYASHRINADYGTYYNWNPVKNLNIKAGGCFDLLMGMTTGKPNHINNLMDIDVQGQFKAAAGIKYGWKFKKWGLFLQAGVAVPFMGFASGGNEYSSALNEIIGSEILPGKNGAFHLTSFHNLTGCNTDLEIDFEFKKTVLFFKSEYHGRWWHFNGVQNYRIYSLSKIGLMVDLVARERLNSNRRFF